MSPVKFIVSINVVVRIELSVFIRQPAVSPHSLMTTKLRWYRFDDSRLSEPVQHRHMNILYGADASTDL